jgi:hypothetical protein
MSVSTIESSGNEHINFISPIIMNGENIINGGMEISSNVTGATAGGALRFGFYSSTSYIQAAPDLTTYSRGKILFTGIDGIDNSALSVDILNYKIGINKDTPDYTLDVAGSIRASDFISTSLINMSSLGASNGQIIGLSTINGLAWPLVDDALWSKSGNNIYNDNTGNVGIGTNNPQAMLHVNGSAQIDNNLVVKTFLTINSGANDIGGNAPGSTICTFIRNSSTGTQTIDYQVAADGAGFTNNWIDTRFVYYPSTNTNYNAPVWGIATSSLSNIMDDKTVGNIRFFQNAQVDKSLYTNNGIINTNTGIRLFDQFSNSSTRPPLRPTSILSSFVIHGSGTAGGTGNDSSGNDGFLQLSAGGGTDINTISYIQLSGFSANTNSSDMDRNIVLGTSGAERMRIDTNGNVGIGTTTPQQKLDIYGGNLNVTGIMYISSSNYNCKGAIDIQQNAATNYVTFEAFNSSNTIKLPICILPDSLGSNDVRTVVIGDKYQTGYSNNILNVIGNSNFNGTLSSGSLYIASGNAVFTNYINSDSLYIRPYNSSKDILNLNYQNNTTNLYIGNASDTNFAYISGTSGEGLIYDTKYNKPPVLDVTGGTGINVTSTNGTFTVAATGVQSVSGGTGITIGGTGTAPTITATGSFGSNNISTTGNLNTGVYLASQTDGYINVSPTNWSGMIVIYGITIPSGDSTINLLDFTNAPQSSQYIVTFSSGEGNGGVILANWYNNILTVNSGQFSGGIYNINGSLLRYSYGEHAEGGTGCVIATRIV